MRSFENVKNIVENEVNEVLSSIKEEDVNSFIDSILKAKKVCGYGAGRMGYGLRAFMMRLNHFGIQASFINDTFCAPMDENDLFIVTSGSGETRSVLEYLKIAKEHCNTVAITGNDDSSMAKLADKTVIFKSSNGGLNSADNEKKINSIQPMTSLNEQAMFLFFDIVAVMLIERLGIQKKDEKKFHFNIE